MNVIILKEYEIMKKGELVQILDNYSNDADVMVAVNPTSLMVVEGCLAVMIKLDGEWDYTGKGLKYD